MSKPKQVDVIDFTNKGEEVVDVIPDKYDNTLRYDKEKGNYISLRFYEHDYSVKKYLKKRGLGQGKNPINFDSIINFPLITASQIFRISLTVGANQGDLDFVKNLAYDSLTEDNDAQAVEKTINEAIEAPLEKIEDLYDREGSVTTASDIAIAKGVATTLKSESRFFSGSKFASGVAYNPNTRVLFDLKSEPIHRVFMFNFVLYPKNEKEMKKIRRAEYLLFHHALPTRWKGGQLLGQFDNQYINHFKYPKKVQPVVFVGGKEFKKFRFMEAVITNVTSNPQTEENDTDVTFIQNENGQVFSKKFVLAITIQESKMFTRNDIENEKGKISDEDILQY